LCGVPYEVARSGGHFKNHGLNVELVYTRGGSAAMQALVGGAVDYGATSLDVAVTAFGNAGADIRRFAVTGRLPLFAVVTAPKTASTITNVKALEGKTVGISALGNADHALTLYLLKQAGADATKVKFATLGVNLLEALRQGQVDVGLVGAGAHVAAARRRPRADERHGSRGCQELSRRRIRVHGRRGAHERVRAASAWVALAKP
jgi:NitT/TauT family transport system substrate-binding protein